MRQSAEGAGVSRRELIVRGVVGAAALAGAPAAAAARAAGRLETPAAAAGGLVGPAAGAGRATGFRNSLSVSPFTEAVLRELALTDGRSTARTVAGVQRLFNRHGATEVYARIATRRHARQGDAEHGFAHGIARARLARSLGLPFNPELGLFAVYGDSGSYQQPPDFSGYPSIRLPGPWTSLTLAQMTAALRHYGELVARQVLATGVRVEWWDLGNEVEFGVAGVAVRPLLAGNGTYAPPDGIDPAIGQMSTAALVAMSEADRIAWLRRHLWPAVGRLLAATAAGVRAVDRSARFGTHISGIFQPTAAVPLAFWEAMGHAGYRPDVLGASFYPTAGALLGPGNRYGWLKSTATALSRRFHRRLFIAEGAYPSGILHGGFPYNTPVPGYPLTVDGQRRFIGELIAWGAGSGRLAGFRPWAPDYCIASGDWEPMSYFTASGATARAKPALSATREALARVVQARSRGAGPSSSARSRPAAVVQPS